MSGPSSGSGPTTSPSKDADVSTTGKGGGGVGGPGKVIPLMWMLILTLFDATNPDVNHETNAEEAARNGHSDSMERDSETFGLVPHRT
jgi:hypothetical protein